ncbi:MULTISPECIES: hypothetical protein [Streptomyces]|uniref:hypothetical protein n=1 Tax=Streptomyces TaxID=1883 RepID=UPI0018E04074|nr:MULTISPECIES: hypothetical protein [Streptomyces]MCZ4102496.1 hypothetical protein [Streptomyces sp. H39-C1]
MSDLALSLRWPSLCASVDEPPPILTGGSGDWTVDMETGRPHLTLNADYPAGHYVRLDEVRHVPDLSR